MPEHLLTIGEVATRSGVSRKALRLYEARGIVSKPRRTPAGYRVYEADVLGVLHLITQARRLGLTLKEIRHIIDLRSAKSGPCVHVRAARTETRRPRQPPAGSEKDPQQLGRLTRNPRCRLPAHRRRKAAMDKISLCPACSACPEVAIDGDTVRIGEEGNLVTLKKEEWNVLVDVINSGKVGKL
jgi:DNA-binding transcriptional MerR regulator